MESARWILYDAICTMESAQWNLHDGNRTQLELGAVIPVKRGVDLQIIAIK